GLGPSAGIFEILRFARQFTRQLEVGAPQGAVARLGECLQQLSLGLAKGGIVEQARLSEVISDDVWDQHQISMDLLRSHEEDPRSLQWMSRTVAEVGALALWAGPGSRHELEIVGIFDRENTTQSLVHERFDTRCFPPDVFLERSQKGGPHDLVVLLPVRTVSSDWGFLLLVAPVGSALLSQESYFQWSALLSQALDYEAVTKSVRQSNYELAVSYQRERDLAETIRKSEERYALAAKAANDGLWDWDLVANEIYYSERWKQTLGFSENAISNNPEEWLSRTHPDDRTSLMEAICQRRRGDNGPFELEHRVRAADGSYRWMLCRGLGVPDDGRPAVRLVGSLTDITERKALEDQLVHQALYDSLTGLPNRALFLDRLSQSIAYARRSPGYEYAVLYLDLDGFKVVNDSLGHLVGDKLLVKVAKRVAGHLREADTAARFGGDEFAVLLHHVPDFGAVERIVSRLQTDLAEPYALDGHEVVVTASIGIASSSNSYDKPEDVIRDADIAMYRAKSAGRSGYTTFDSSMHAGAMSRLQTESALRQAIERGQLELHYQPIVALGDGTLQAMEVLVRWRHPTRGLIAPGEFLPVAEESGLIVPMGRWIQTETCRQLAEWKARGIVADQLRASINLSNKEFWNPGLLDQVDNVLASTGVPPRWVTFEITEGVIMHNLPQALEVLAALRQRGFEIHIDDFGTGYSSLEALHKLPIDALKIDRSFVSNLADDKSHELVRTIIQLGRNLSVYVIAEGIEDPGQQHTLRELGCPLGQGYWFSMPVPAGRLGELLSTGRALPPERQQRVPDLATARPAGAAHDEPVLVEAATD
ncbi:MAG TPA: EAL domain-containing protein, partial [Acidimicrobiales bacterium]|nr:EAL domain-containing protein [Acidimicrobiales bacterium]